MRKFAEFIVKKRYIIILVTILLLIPAFVGMNSTKINYDILVYLPDDIETIKGQKYLTDDFDMGAFSITIVDNMSSKEILALEQKIKDVSGVAKVISAYDIVGTNIPLEILPDEITSKIKNGDDDLIMITYDKSTSDKDTLDAVEQVKQITDDSCNVSGMSAMVLDTMNLSNHEILVYVIVAVIICLFILELSLDSFIVPFLLLFNIGIAILFNLGTNVFLGEISYITKALVAVLQLGVTTDFSIFLYHSYQNKRRILKDKNNAMIEAIKETFTSVIGSSLTTIAGFLVLCTMQLTLGKDLGIVMAKGVLLGVISVLTVFPGILLIFDNLIEKTKHKVFLPSFSKLNSFIVKHNKKFLCLFLILLIPAYLANSKVDVYYKLDESLPDYLDSIVANKKLAEEFNIVSPEIILLSNDLKNNDISLLVSEIEKVKGIDFVLSPTKLESIGITEDMLSDELVTSFKNEEYQMIILNSTYEIASDELNQQVDVVKNIVKKYDKKAIVAGEGPLMKDLVSITDTDFRNVNTSSIVIILIIMFIILRSISLPFLLTISIEFAIFINFAISYFSGVTLPFVAPIVLGTIQLGATIDYAILLTTTYLSKRKEVNDKNKAMKETLDRCVPSILVSALCFFGATFGVGIISELEMISSLCTLMSRGAIISMIVVIMILPSIILLFDKLIMNTTKINKGGKIMKSKKIVALLLISTFIFMPKVNALSKEETVYATLKGNGDVKQIIVNEYLKNTKKLNTIEDVSDLENIVNINGNEKFSKQNNNLTWSSNGNDIFYKGNTTKDLPLKVSVKYYIDDVEYNLQDMIGKKGKITIKIIYQNNDKHVVNIGNRSEILYTPFVVTTTSIIDSKNNSNIEITNGKVINTGTKNIVVGLSTPGLYESINLGELKGLDEITINYETKKFELPNIYTIATPKLLEETDFNIFNKLDSLYSNVDALQTNINTIETGVQKLLDGTKKIGDGNSKIYENLQLVLKGIDDLESGSSKVNGGIDAIISTLEASNEGAIEKLNSVDNLIQANNKAIESIKNAIPNIDSIYNNFNLTNMRNENIMSLTKEVYAQYGLNLTDEEVLVKNKELVTVKSNYELIKLLQTNNAVLGQMKEQILSILEKINQLDQSLKQLSSGSRELTNGITKLKNGLGILSLKQKEIVNGTNELSSGIDELSNGISKYNNEGIKKLSNYSNIVKTKELKVKELINLSKNYNNFGLKNHDTYGTTKFVYVINGVKEKNSIKTIKKVETKETTFDRIKNLFN